MELAFGFKNNFKRKSHDFTMDLFPHEGFWCLTSNQDFQVPEANWKTLPDSWIITLTYSYILEMHQKG